METFLSKHAGAVIGVLSGFDRLVFRGTLRQLAYSGGMMAYLWAEKVLLKDFAEHAETLTRRVKQASEDLARRTARPVHFLPSSGTSKEEMASKIAREDGIEEGLVCVLTAVEPCRSCEVYRNRETRRLELLPRQRKCLHIYHYYIHPVFGFMNARIQTWFPFSIQICLNGREWLARQMDQVGLGYAQRDNCFVWLEDPERAQSLIKQQLQSPWPGLLDDLAGAVNPCHDEMFASFPVDYYWSVFQSEWATDILFRDAGTLARLYPKLVHHALVTFLSPDVMRFLGRKVSAAGAVPPRLEADVVSDMKTRPEGVRIKHRLGGNSIKMYDKQGSVLRVETTINEASGFKSFRAPEGRPEAGRAWLRKGIADLHRRAEVCEAANQRYLQALASVDDPLCLGELADRVCQPTSWNGRRVRALNPYAAQDARLIEAISRGEFIINGFRNRDLRALVFADRPAAPPEQRRQAAAVSRTLALLRAHGLIKKVHGTHRYHLTDKGRTIATALITARNANTETLMKLAA